MSLTDLYRRMFRRAVATKRSKIRLNVTALEDRSVPASISGTVFYDTNQDGFQDNGELVASGINVIYRIVNGDVAHGATTDTSGFYSFNDVSPGSYEVSFQPPANYTVGTPAGGSTFVTVDTSNLTVNASLVDSYVGPGRSRFSADIAAPAVISAAAIDFASAAWTTARRRDRRTLDFDILDGLD